MSLYKPWANHDMYLAMQDYGVVHLPPAEEEHEDWSHRRWGLAQFDTPESKEILRDLIRAETRADTFLDENIPPKRPEPDWLTDEED